VKSIVTIAKHGGTDPPGWCVDGGGLLENAVPAAIAMSSLVVAAPAIADLLILSFLDLDGHAMRETTLTPSLPMRMPIEPTNTPTNLSRAGDKFREQRRPPRLRGRGGQCHYARRSATDYAVCVVVFHPNASATAMSAADPAAAMIISHPCLTLLKSTPDWAPETTTTQRWLEPDATPRSGT
jgi:hypothetical protein